MYCAWQHYPILPGKIVKDVTTWAQKRYDKCWVLSKPYFPEAMFSLYIRRYLLRNYITVTPAFFPKLWIFLI